MSEKVSGLIVIAFLLALVGVVVWFQDEISAALKDEDKRARVALVEQRHQSIGYMRDERTGFCFAFVESVTYAQSNPVRALASVPCTPEVERLLDRRAGQ